MSINLKEKLKNAGRQNVRVLPENEKEPFGSQLVQINENGTWTTIMVVPSRIQAENMLSESVNRIILG